MMQIDYSVIIRTTGNAHEKYEALLASVDRLRPKPADVIVALPEGYALPKEKLGYETYCFSEKGMVRQRMAGVARCRTRYALICDDDVVFPPDFAARLYEPLEEGKASFSVAPLYSFLPEPGLKTLWGAVTASAVPTVFHRSDRYVSVLKSTGYSFNRFLKPSVKYYETQSAAWTCFFADVQALRSIHFEEESWLDAHGYSALDDQTMFYKAWLLGKKTAAVADARYDHLDAKTSKKNNRPGVLYSGTFNRVVFWHRFIYLQQDSGLNRMAAVIAFHYRMGWIFINNRISVFRKRMTGDDCRISRQGYLDGKQYLKSGEYAKLPVIR